MSAPSGATGANNGGLWSGNLNRTQYVCSSTAGVAVAQPPSDTTADVYADNVNSPDVTHPRQFLTAIPAPTSNINNPVNPDLTLRPGILADDGFGTANVSTAPTTKENLTNFITSMSAGTNPEAFGISNTPSNNTACLYAFGNTQQGVCTQDLLNWEFGGVNVLPTTVPFVTRNQAACAIGQTCSALGAIYHSTPAVAGPPSDGLRDDTYVTYASNAAVASQPIMLYTATTDGQLHAFEVAATHPSSSAFEPGNGVQNNELWSFMPPHVLQHLLGNYNSQVILLDGAPVWADVPGQVSAAGDGGTTSPPNFSRSQTQDSQASLVQWHRVLLASGGENGSFYYALDITDPTNPQFLWQLSTDAVGNPMFGKNTPTPTIASVSVYPDPTHPSTPTQVAVAILPGGSGSLVTCPSSGNPVSPATSGFMPSDPSNHNNSINVPATPATVNCWQAAGGSTGNSLTIARLDTGQVLMHFTGPGYKGAPSTSLNGTLNTTLQNVTSAGFLAPVTGVPAAYPNGTGDIADRIYVGDADGLLWRVNLSSPNPHNWTVQAVWDAYSLTNDQPSLREGVQQAPIISRDALGNVTLLYATGDQETFSVTTTSTRLWSLTDTSGQQATTTSSWVSPNWWIDFGNLAPGKMREPLWRSGSRARAYALFNSVAYFATYTPVANGNVCREGPPPFGVRTTCVPTHPTPATGPSPNCPTVRAV